MYTNDLWCVIQSTHTGLMLRLRCQGDINSFFCTPICFGLKLGLQGTAFANLSFVQQQLDSQSLDFVYSYCTVLPSFLLWASIAIGSDWVKHTQLSPVFVIRRAMSLSASSLSITGFLFLFFSWDTGNSPIWVCSFYLSKHACAF